MTAQFGPHWTPDRIRELTPTELICAASPRPPGREPIRTAGEWEAALERIRDEEAAWSA